VTLPNATPLEPAPPPRVGSGARRPWRLVVPKAKDPRWTLAVALSTWTIFGQTFLYFDRDPLQVFVCIGTAMLTDFLLSLLLRREIIVPISAYITGLSVGILLESYDWRVFAAACVWGIASKHLLRAGDRHFFNPSNFSIVSALVLGHGIATVAPGSQWGGDFRVALLIMALGLLMMKRVGRLDLVLAWIAGFAVMGLVRMALGQGGLVFAIGPVTGAEFTLFSFSMLPDPKANPPTRNGRIVWGLLIAGVDGVLRYLEVRYSMFYALFGFCALLPVFRLIAAARGVEERDPWKVAVLVLRGSSSAAR
jgi:Na+-transporting NADH:ubiquinone oxidoreductase subunit NqrB